MVDFGLLVIRAVVGLTMLAHGVHMIRHPDKVRGTLGRLGLPPLAGWVFLVCFAQAVGGLLLALGLLTVAGGAMITSVMFVVVLWKGKNGFWGMQDGCELPLLLTVAAAGLVLAGPGGYSLDAWLGLDPMLRQPALVGAAMAAALAGALVTWLSRRPAPVASGAGQAARAGGSS